MKENLKKFIKILESGKYPLKSDSLTSFLLAANFNKISNIISNKGLYWWDLTNLIFPPKLLNAKITKFDPYLAFDVPFITSEYDSRVNVALNIAEYTKTYGLDSLIDVLKKIAKE